MFDNPAPDTLREPSRNLRTMTELINLSKTHPAGLPVFRLVTVGDCATQHLSLAIRGAGIARGLDIQVLDTDYNQITAQTLDPESELFRYRPDGVFIMNCTEVLWLTYTNTPAADRPGFADRMYEIISAVWKNLNKNHHFAILQSLFTEYDDRAFGSFASRLPFSFLYQLRRLNLKICEGAATTDNVYPVDFSFAAYAEGLEKAKSTKMFVMAKMPFSTDFMPEAASAAVDIIASLRGKIVKCVVTDLDNTLWGGTVGEIGADRIEIGSFGIGPVFTEYQKWLLELKRRGILLAVCSKNDDDKAKEPFLYNRDMTLRLEDFALFYANWEPKSQNIRAIQKTLNIGMDSIVFLDDNPFERREVKSALPEVIVPELPDDPAEVMKYLRRSHLFETVTFSAEDAARTDMYRAEAGRQQAAETYGSYEEYLEKLFMSSESAPFRPEWYPRIAELSQRSNQFNLRTVRYTESEIREIAENSDAVTRYFKLQDRFGDCGLIGAVILKPLDRDTLFVDTWFMSCRVLKRTMEEFIVNQIVEAAREAGFRKVIGEYLPTPKNGMVADIYAHLGFASLGGGRFEADTASFRPNPTFVSLYRPRD